MKIALDVDYKPKFVCENPFMFSCGRCSACISEGKRFRKAYRKALLRELYKLGWSKNKNEKAK